MDQSIDCQSELFIFVNGNKFEITRDCNPEMSLNDFLREVLQLKGTKVMCREAGCGCCVVCAFSKHPATGKVEARPVNSCITPLYSTVGWHVVTVEGIGSSRSGHHPIQSRLADGYGSQCGYCSPGFVMSMFSQLQETPQPTMQQVEHFFDGNICRCTGYRPILESMKTFACDSDSGKCIDVEDLDRGCCKQKIGKVPTSGVAPVARGWRGQKFYNPGSLQELLTLLGRVSSSSYRLLVGNTSAGIFKDETVADHYINIRNVPELHKIEETAAGLEIGANVTLHELIEAFESVGSRNPKLRHLVSISQHYQQVANQAVRHNASWAGNLMLKHGHHDFPSDIFVTMEAARAVVKVMDAAGVQEHILTDFLQLNMSGKLIVSAVLPANCSDRHCYRSFKITPRTLNAHAYVNAAFNCAVDRKDDCRVTERPSFVFGGISHKFHHATKTENFLLNKSLLDQSVVDGAMKVLESEVNPAEEATMSSPQHRRGLAANLMYKFILAVGGDALAASVASGAEVLERPTQTSQQEFEEELRPSPLGKAMPKQEARAQAAGEAKYANDFPSHANELFASFVLAPEAPASLKGFDTEEAEQVPGFHRLVTAKDLEGRYDNNAVTAFIPAAVAPTEEILVSSDIHYAGQPVAVVLATSQWAADQAAGLVVVDFEQTGEPITSISEAVAKKSVMMEMPEENVGTDDFDSVLEKQPTKVSGQLVVNEQVHFFIETVNASAMVTEEGLVVTLPHQGVDALAMTLARIMRRPTSQIRVVSPRIGGGFGGKLFMCDQVAAVVAICADMEDRPVRMYMTLDKNLELGMKRPGLLMKYSAGADADGKLQAISWDINMELGYSCNIQPMLVDEMKHLMDMGFCCPNYRMQFKLLRTNKPSSTAVRAPGQAPSSVANILLMDHVAFELGVDPVEFKRNHLYMEGDVGIDGDKRTNDRFQQMWAEMLTASDFENRQREIAEFNKNNQFRKRGIDMSATSYNLGYVRGRPSTVHLAVQGSDGTMTLTHSGAEMGQGLGVKCAQAVAAVLGVDIDIVKVKPTDSHVVPNSEVTGGSVTSEINCQAAVNAAEQLKKRLQPIREANPNGAWAQITNAAVAAGISLSAVGCAMPDNGARKGSAYATTGVGVVEAEVDILTGEYQIRRADVMMDLGKSLNPGVDVGQVEGAFVMGMGYFLLERTVYDADNGRNLTNGTWNYKVPQAADTPRDFRVHLLKRSDNPAGVFSTKAVGEPPFGLSAMCVTAIKRAIEAFREQQGKPRVFLSFDLPLTPEKVLQLSEVSGSDRKVQQK